MKRTDAVQIIKRVTDYNKELGDHFADELWFIEQNRKETDPMLALDSIDKTEWMELLRVLKILGVITKDERIWLSWIKTNNFEWEAEEDYRR